jgi:hypothetical protein
LKICAAYPEQASEPGVFDLHFLKPLRDFFFLVKVSPPQMLPAYMMAAPLIKSSNTVVSWQDILFIISLFFLNK